MLSLIRFLLVMNVLGPLLIYFLSGDFAVDASNGIVIGGMNIVSEELRSVSGGLDGSRVLVEDVDLLQ
jgi:hypothetical protein